MTKLRFLGAAAVVLSSALAVPSVAQQVITDPGYCAQFYPNANCQNKGPGNPYTGNYQRRAMYRTNAYGYSNGGWNNGWNGGWNNGWNTGWNDSWNNNRWYGRDYGFGPGDVAAGVVGGAAATAGAAAGTAGAIATAPFRGGSYASYNGDRNWYYSQNYATQNGLVCRPGTWFKGEDGRRHRCR
jgi:hypothetical protein